MKRTFLLIGAAVAALSLSACGQKTEGAATPVEKAETPDAHPAATVLTVADETKAGVFVDEAIEGNTFEIDAGKAALAKSANADVKAFAKMMVADHTKTAAAMKRAIGSSGLTIIPVKTPTEDMTKMLDELNGAADFDKTYADDMVDGHQKMLDLLQHYAQAGDNKVLQDFAAATAPAVEKHLMLAKDLKAGLK